MSATSSSRLFIVGAKRTPFGAFGGKLKGFTTTDLGEVAAKAAVKAAGISPENIDTVIFGNVAPSSKDGAYLARHVGIRTGVPDKAPGLTVNRLCGSGFQAIVSGAHELLLGEGSVALCGGAESMSQAPFVLRNMRFGTTLGQNYECEDMLWATLTDQQIKTPMGVTAETLGAKYGITREQCDEFALRSQTRWRLANNAGHFHAEMAPVSVKTKKGTEEVSTDEHPRETSMEALGKLPPVFKKEGLVSAGNASGICDGAGAIVLATEEAMEKHALEPLVRLVGWQVVGVDPNIMGIGPSPAIKALLARSKLSLKDIDLFEVNEAFAAQYLSVEKDLSLSSDNTNVNGGAIALGHPVGASGARITAHLCHELRRREAKYAIGSACIGGGQGIALLFERHK